MTPPMPVRLLIADVDETLLTDGKVLTEAASDAVGEQRGAGIELAIVSSRPPFGVRMLAEPRALSCTMAGLNGGICLNSDLFVVLSYELDAAVAAKAVDVIQKGEPDAWLYTQRERLLDDQEAPHVEREVWILKFEPKVVRSFSNA